MRKNSARISNRSRSVASFRQRTAADPAAGCITYARCSLYTGSTIGSVADIVTVFMLGLGLGNLAGGKSQRPPECVFADEAFETSEVAAAEWHATCDTKAQELGLKC